MELIYPSMGGAQNLCNFTLSQEFKIPKLGALSPLTFIEYDQEITH